MQWHDTIFIYHKRDRERERAGRREVGRAAGAFFWKCCQTYFTYILLSSFVSLLNGNNLTKWIGQEAGEKKIARWERRSGGGGEVNLNAIVQQQQQQQISCGTLATNAKNEKLFLYPFLQLIKPTQVTSPPPPSPPRYNVPAVHSVNQYKYWQFMRAGVRLGAWIYMQINLYTIRAFYVFVVFLSTNK